jgi:hypothetical protein
VSLGRLATSNLRQLEGQRVSGRDTVPGCGDPWPGGTIRRVAGQVRPENCRVCCCGETMVTVTAYEALVQSASQLIEPDAFGDLDDGDLSAASELLEHNRAALQSARCALSQRCAVPVRYEESFFSDHCDDFSHLRNLARAFRAEALLAASHENYGAAALVGIEMLDLGNAARRGGLVTDAQVGIAISGIALDIQQMADLPESDLQKMQLDQDNRGLALLRMLVVDLALRSWRETFHTFPDGLVSLTPSLLPTLPLDPYTGKSLLYRPLNDTSFFLYSTGPKAFDGGGEFGPWPHVAAGCADLCLDADDYW